MIARLALLGVAVAAMSAMGCSMSDVAAAKPAAPLLRHAANLRVFFGHQSVGNNILDGVREVAPRLSIVHGEAPPAGPALVETMIGRNEDPDSKLDHFARVMSAHGDDFDVAMFKFCYVDFSARTNVAALEDRYRRVMSDVTAAHGQTRIVHITVPLTITQSGPKAMVKGWLGRPVWGALENQKRSEFNDWLRTTYAGQPLFDLAAIESRTPSGQLATFQFGGRSYPMLYPEYSDDGGHLSDVGGRVVATAFVNMLESVWAGSR